MEDTFFCDNCKETFPKGWSDEEANKEKDHLFPNEEDLVIVCDECFHLIMDYNEPGLKRYNGPFV